MNVPVSHQTYNVQAYLDWLRPYFTPTPTLGSALITFFTVAWSGNANIMAAERQHKTHMKVV